MTAVRSSQFAVRGDRGALTTGCLLCLGGFAVAQQLTPQTRFSTHDWTAPEAHLSDFAEGWADVKTPGDGRTYAVGTIEVRNTASLVVPLPTFSQASASASTALQGFFLGSGPGVQVVMLQVSETSVDAAGVVTQPILWQRYFFGSTGQLRPTNARAVSVWPAGTPEHTRVVICGETLDAQLPLSQAPAGWPAGTPLSASGFIAVYNGLGDLKWTHHLFGANANGQCAVTDISVRVEYQGTIPVRDVITYCGISSHGNPISNEWLTTAKPYLAQPGGLPCSNPAGGDRDNGFGQWDGFVGRVSRDHLASLPSEVEFHSVVGGNEQDGLFGLAELPDDRFVVVGSTAGGRPGLSAPSSTYTHRSPVL